MNLTSLFRTVEEPTTTRRNADRAQLLREQRKRIAARANIHEFQRDDLEFEPYGGIQHRDGTRYKVLRSDVLDERNCGAAYFLDAAGSPVFLELVR